jgi:MarR family transcriptional regulator, lower aerobic nicotinate degradation pathway regulator
MLANAVVLDRTTTTGALKRLAARRLLERATDLTDRRAQICRLTAEGARLHAAMEETAREAHALTVQTLTPSDQKLLAELMRRVLTGQEHRRTQSDIR